MPAAQDYYYKIRTCLARMWAETYIDSASNLQDSKVFCENVIKDVLNEVFDWNLVNGNKATFNVGGFDLKDDSKKILIQVSATTTKEKVNNSIEKSDIDEFEGYRLIMFGIGIGEYPMIYEKTGGYLQPSKITFDKDKDRWTIRTLSKEIQSITDIPKLERITNKLQSQYGHVDKWIPPKRPKEPQNCKKLFNWIITNKPEEEWELEQIQESSCLLFEKLNNLTTELLKIYCKFVQKAEYTKQGNYISITINEPIVTSTLNENGIFRCYNTMKTFSDKSLTSEPESSSEDGYFTICPGDEKYYFFMLHDYLINQNIPFESIFVDLDFSQLDEMEK